MRWTPNKLKLSNVFVTKKVKLITIITLQEMSKYVNKIFHKFILLSFG
jgi:hypothetical protein